MRTYRLQTPAFVALIECNEADVIVSGAPICKWAFGKSYDILLNWCKKKWPEKVNSMVLENS